VSFQSLFLPVPVMSGNNKRALVLTSGGIDSTACVKYYQDLGFKVEGFFVDYGQKSRLKERESVQKIASFYNIDIKFLDVDVKQTFSLGEIKGRNGFLIMAAMLAKPDFRGLISLGIHAGVPYYDCSNTFAKKMSVLVTEYSNGQFNLDFPFLEWDKKMICFYCKDMKVPVHLTYSCENGDEPCGKCQSCLDRMALNVC
jgi:7-cyano-7-deazaguanine synthase